MHTALRHLYTLLLWLILPFLPLHLLWKSRRNRAYRHRILERFALDKLPTFSQTIWIHAVSVGEALAAIPLINMLLANHPTTQIVVTTMTPTGAQRIHEALGAQVHQRYLPYDYPYAIKRLLKKLAPRILVLMETELWPNLLHYTAAQQLPILLANARISDHSLQHYQKITYFLQPLFQDLSLAAAQSPEDANRLKLLGFPDAKLHVTGNLKFDLKISDEILGAGQKLRQAWGSDRPVWVAGSTHAGEEIQILQAAHLINQQVPNALLILVPRHPERFDEVFKLCQAAGFQTARYSHGLTWQATPAILLGDVMGQLLQFYASADLAFVGGSLVPWGGHNLLEPAALAKPIIAGPNRQAFLAISQMLTDANALITVANATELAAQVSTLFKNRQLQAQLGCAALDVLARHRGATTQVYQLLQKLLPN